MQPLTHYQDLEVESRRKGVAFPNAGPSLKLRGVCWPIPSRGVEVRPAFTGKDVGVSVKQDDWPEADALLSEAPMREGARCPKCNQPIQASLEIDPDEKKFLTLLFGLGARLLREYHDLSDEQLAELMSIGNDEPVWVAQLIRWCTGQGTDLPEPTAFDLESALASLPEDIPIEPKRSFLNRILGRK